MTFCFQDVSTPRHAGLGIFRSWKMSELEHFNPWMIRPNISLLSLLSQVQSDSGTVRSRVISVPEHISPLTFRPGPFGSRSYRPKRYFGSALYQNRVSSAPVCVLGTFRTRYNSVQGHFDPRIFRSRVISIPVHFGLESFWHWDISVP